MLEGPALFSLGSPKNGDLFRSYFLQFDLVRAS